VTLIFVFLKLFLKLFALMFRPHSSKVLGFQMRYNTCMKYRKKGTRKIMFFKSLVFDHVIFDGFRLHLSEMLHIRSLRRCSSDHYAHFCFYRLKNEGEKLKILLKQIFALHKFLVLKSVRIFSVMGNW
jgi:hypothetical protein